MFNPLGYHEIFRQNYVNMTNRPVLMGKEVKKVVFNKIKGASGASQVFARTPL